MSYPQRKSPRLQGYDYTQNGAYFVTVCVQEQRCLFGHITADELSLNAAGEMISTCWQQLPKKFPNLELDHSVVMPNHFHGIVLLYDHSPNIGLDDVMHWFKTITTNAYIRGVKQHGWIPFEGKLWQRSYYDHIIRDERGLNAIREYIMVNPAKWAEDRLYRE